MQLYSLFGRPCRDVCVHLFKVLHYLQEQGRELPGYVQREFEDYLKCGRLEHGFCGCRASSTA